MASLNKVILMGNLTRDPEVRYTAGGTAVAKMGLAVNDRIKRGDEWVDSTCFIDFVAFGRQAENAGEYLNKGSQVLVEGRLQLNQWETAEGQKRSRHEVVANNIQYLSKASRAGVDDDSRHPSQGARRSPGPAPLDDDDLPF